LSLPAYLASRAALFAAAWAANALLPYGRPQDPLHPAPVQAWLSWDAVHYLRIARDGYPAAASSVDNGFFPLLPAVLHALGAQPGPALAFSFLAGLAGVAVLAALTASLLGEDAARRTAWIASWWPEAFVLSAVYTEGIFLALAAGALWAAWKRHPVLAAGLGAAAGALRPTGAALAVPLFVLLPAGRARLAALAPCLGAAGFAGYLWIITGTPTAFLASQVAHHPVRPGVPFAQVLSGRPEELVGLAFLAGVALLAWQLWRLESLGPWRAAAMALVVAMLLPPIASGTLSSFGRYAMAAFPLFWAAARTRLAPVAAAGIPASLALTMAAGTGRLTP